MTIVVALLFATYMLLDPSKWMSSFMQLTDMRWDFKIFILTLGAGYIVLAWSLENYILPRLAKVLGILQTMVSRTPKEKKKYKAVLEQMRTLQ